MVKKPSRIWFDKKDGFIKIDDRIRYLVLLKYNEIFDKIRYLQSEKSGTIDRSNHNFARLRIDSYNSFPVEKILTFHNVMILIKSVVSKNKNPCHYNIILEKCLYKDKSDTQYF